MIEQLGPYRIDGLLGRGGMGSVYSGVHQESEERAAIKVLSKVLADDGNFRERFVAEIETLKKLDHPNIVRLFGEGEEDGYLFYVMELVEGSSLQVELQKGAKYDWLEVVEIAIQICAALKHAHDRGVIHRDLKPANLLRTDIGVIKLTDFGIAKLFGSTQLTADGSVVGTADFMAPEQAEGKPVTNRTDLYSLGSVLFTLLARRPPFTSSSVPQVIHKLRYDHAPSVRRYAPGTPEPLEAVIAELLEKDPQARTPTALVLSKRLQAMRHALTTDTATAIDDRSGWEETPTQEQPINSAPPTEVSPTAVDDGKSDSAPEDYSWNEATIVTSGESVAEPEPANKSFQSRDTIADEPVVEAPSQSRFSHIGEEELKRARGEVDEWNGQEGHRQTLLLAAALVGLVVLAVVWAWPPSADELYGDIQETVAATTVVDANRDVEQFLERFPEDPRATEVRLLQSDIQADWLQSRLALAELKSGGAALQPYQEIWLEAMRAKPQKPAEATVLFQEIMRRFSHTPEPSRELQEILRATQHQLERLGINGNAQLDATVSGEG